MSETQIVSENVKQFLSEIIAENGLNPNSKIDYGPGAEVGEGFNSKTFTADVKDGEKELHMFIKMQSGLSWHQHFDKMFGNEIYFYNTIYPAYQAFLQDYCIEDGFRNAPKCYGARSDIIVLENLGAKRFVTFENKALMDDAHILLVMRTLAKLHAISFAFKDQKKELYDNFRRNLHPCVTDIYRTAGFDKVTSAYIRKLLNAFDPDKDEHILKASRNLERILLDALFSVDDCVNEYSIISQGDCWSNNILFSYEENDLRNLKDVMLVDWQLIRHASPAIDLGYFFYPMATETTIEKFDYYMKEYHKELSMRIRELGSDPEILYPYTVLESEWKKFVKYGFAMSFIIIEGLLMEKDEIPDFQENPDVYKNADVNEVNSLCATPPMRNEKLFIERIKTILKHFVKHDLL